MNYIKHLAGFFERVAADERLNPSHISMYVSLFQFWNVNRFQNPISVARSEIMRVSKISARVTYHKCLNELHQYGYLRYVPSHNPMKGSLIYLFNFQASSQQTAGHNRTKKRTTGEQLVGHNRTKKRTTGEQVVGPFINGTNINKQENIVNEGDGFGDGYSDGKSRGVIRETQDDRVLGDGDGDSESQGMIRETQDDRASIQRKKKNIPQSLEEVIEYFSSRGHGEQEAERYYNHFCSNGWLVGGKAPMKDWKAAARNWMLNTKTYNNDTRQSLHPGNLHATTAKDYAEPL